MVSALQQIQGIETINKCSGENKKMLMGPTVKTTEKTAKSKLLYNKLENFRKVTP
jgi:hypothetical protein